MAALRCRGDRGAGERSGEGVSKPRPSRTHKPAPVDNFCVQTLGSGMIPGLGMPGQRRSLTKTLRSYVSDARLTHP